MDAWVNLSGLLLKQRQLHQALQACEEGLEVQAYEPRLICQLNTILRHLGRQQEAIVRTWQAISHAVIKAQPHLANVKDYASPSSSLSQEGGLDHAPSSSALVVVCVKYGSKYDATYVNRLAAGVSRHSGSHTYEFICVTDDPQGLDLDLVTCLPLPPDVPLRGWWVKAYLFSPTCPIPRGKQAPQNALMSYLYHG